MRSWCFALVCAGMFIAQPAAAINKCTGSDGKVTFQDAPCSAGRSETIEAKPASGRAPAAATASSPPYSASSAPTEAARLEGIVAASQKSRRVLDLRERLLPDAERALSQHRLACAEKQKTLAANQYAYAQNLYGKTHAAQIASEMAATAAVCDTKDRELKELVDGFGKECVALRCRG
jgi:hypothetical protein